MALLHKTKRVDLGDGEWVDVRPMSVKEMREMRLKVAGIAHNEVETKEEAQGYELTRLALLATIVAWSDDDPVNAENIDRLPFSVTLQIANALGLGEEERPLPSGAPSPASSEASTEEESQPNG